LHSPHFVTFCTEKQKYGPHFLHDILDPRKIIRMTCFRWVIWSSCADPSTSFKAFKLQASSRLIDYSFFLSPQKEKKRIRRLKLKRVWITAGDKKSN